MTELRLVDYLPPAAWQVHGTATIDDRAPVRSRLTIYTDGSWGADVATFTLADTVPYTLTTDEGGQFMGDALVERSRAADTGAMGTELAGVAPLLIVAPFMAAAFDCGMVDAEVVE